MVVIMIGRKRSMHASKIESLVFLPSLRSALRAKSIIIIAFFFTMPIRSTMPMIDITSNCVFVSIIARMAPKLADGRVERIVMGWMRLS